MSLDIDGIVLRLNAVIITLSDDVDDVPLLPSGSCVVTRIVRVKCLLETLYVALSLMLSCYCESCTFTC